MKKLGKFEIIEKVGQGAMGVVYKARDPFIDRIVALKTLTTGLADDANLLKRFYSEARSAGGLQHPNIVTIYELGHEGDTPFIAMQFLSGESLDKILDRRPNLPLSQKVGFIVYVCRALEYAHKQNPPVVHRDIKPGNVMVTLEGGVMVVDFGIARLGEGTRSQSAGMLIGTLGYMSPQLFRNGAADARSDIWATGVMFYELLAYRRPFEGDNAAALMSNIILEKPRSIADAAPGTPPDVQAVLERMLAKEAEARYQSMEEVLLELEPIWRRLQQAEVSDLLANSQQLFDSGDLESAKAKVSQIIQIDTSNTQAKSLLEKINSEVRRKQVVPQLKARVESAGRLLANGQVEDAKAEAEAALKLDSTYQPARELLSQAQAALERARNITQALRTSKQRMAEGALTEAELQLDKVLEIDPGNAAAREQLKQIREERSRRERRKQRDEALHRARTFWTNLRYEECISLLLTAQKELPGDTEIAKLLESARQDQAEQERQSLLTEARSLLSAQRFDDSLKALDRLLERYPSDATAKNLRTHALQGREQQGREQRLAEGKSKLRAWVKEAKYLEVIQHAGQLSKEFPDDFELTELLDFARTELSQLEQKRRFEQSSKKIQQALKDGRYSEAIQSAEKALLEFPKNLDLLILLDRAKKELNEKEKHELLKQRLREVERMVERQELTDAIDLARQTLATVGQDSRIADTLLKAEREFEFREQRKRQQSETVVKARTLFHAGNLADATSLLREAIETQLFQANDPQIAQLFKDIDAKKEPPSTSAAAAAGSRPSATRLGSPISSAPTADPGKDYVYQRGTPLPEDLLTPAPDAVASAFSPTIISGPSAQPAPPLASPVIQPAPEKKEKKRRPALTSAPADASATQMFSRATGSEEAALQLFAAAEEPASVPTVAPPPIWKRPLPMAMAGLALVAVLTVSVYVVVKPSRPTIPANLPTEGTPKSTSEADAPSFNSEPLTPTTSVTPTSKTSPGKQLENAGVLVQGLVTDPAGAVPQANVRITNSAGADRYAFTDGKGHYEMKGLQPGNYKLLVNAGSHTPVELNVTIPSASPRPINISMARSTTTEPPLAVRPRAPEQKPGGETEKAPSIEANNPAPESSPTIVTAPPPPPTKAVAPPAAQPVANSAVLPVEDPKLAINKVLDDLSRAFSNKDIKAIKAIWPSIPKQQADTLETSFRAAKTVSRKFTPITFTIGNDSATVTGSYASNFVIGKDSQIYNGAFTAVLKRKGSTWTIDGLTM
jgi:serine/threonine protein kinase